MSGLYIQLNIHSFGVYGLWRWQLKDYEEALEFSFIDATLKVYFSKPIFDRAEKVDILPSVQFLLYFPNISKEIINNLEKSGEIPKWFAEKIYSYCSYTYRQFQALLMTKAKLSEIMFHELEDISRFFSFPLLRQKWWIGDREPAEFKVTLPKKTKSAFPRKRSININQWKKIQEVVRKNEIISEELLELLKIKSQLINQKKKIAVIEAAILAETLLREYSIKILDKFGLSKSNIKNLKDELSFNSMLNIIFPITLPKSNSKKLQKHIHAINSLRKMRNDIVHGNISETEIENKDVREGIESVIKIIALIKEQLKLT